MAENFDVVHDIIPTAKAHKVTPVREGQSYPIGRRGQYKLFHEHVWPKGYSPQRMADVKSLGIDVVPDKSLTEGLPKVGEHNAAKVGTRLAESYVHENLARSTAPIEELKKMREGVPFTDLGGTERRTLRPSIYVTEAPSGKAAPSFSPYRNRVNFAIEKNEATGADVQRSLMHEVGHAVDFATDPNRFIGEMKDLKENPVEYLYGNRPVPPVAEGRAEGYTAAHSRITRRDRRIGGNTSNWGYRAEGWFFPEMQESFSTSRNEIFHSATGRQFTTSEDEPEVRQEKRPKQLNLFDDGQ